MAHLGDRRRKVRLEVVGALWGTMELAEPARVVELSAGGALILSPVAAAPDAVRVVTLEVAGELVTVDARIRHLRAVPATDTEPTRYLLGVEFLAMPAALSHSVE
jgi:S-adenosylmethionine:diacylglycerol 3-amino-3-carboxypropyl transferase